MQLVQVFRWYDVPSTRSSWVPEVPSLWPPQLELRHQPLYLQPVQNILRLWGSRLCLWKRNPILRLWSLPHAVHLHQSKAPTRNAPKLLHLHLLLLQHRFDVACVQRWMQPRLLDGTVMVVMSQWMGVIMLVLKLRRMCFSLYNRFFQLNSNKIAKLYEVKKCKQYINLVIWIYVAT